MPGTPPRDAEWEPMEGRGMQMGVVKSVGGGRGWSGGRGVVC